MLVFDHAIMLDNENDTQFIAKQLAQLNPTGSIWLSGDLGVGKTTLVRYFLQSLGHIGAVKSPTFTLVEPYQLHQPNGTKLIYHADLYRLDDPFELELMGFFDYFDEPNTLLLIEWASRAKSILPQPDFVIELIKLSNNQRQFVITKC